MSDRFKYSHNGICKLPNVPEIIAIGNGPKEWLFEFNGVRCGIYLTSSDNMVHPTMAASGRETIPSKTPLFLNILSENSEFTNEFKMEALAEGKDPMCYPKIPILEVLNLKNGFLDKNGAMTIEYGFHFDSFFDQIQKIWKFNLKSKIFDCESKKNMISYKGNKIMYSHKQLILFHDTHSKIYNGKNMIDIMEIPNTIKMEYFENFLQIAHGVQLKLYDSHNGFCKLSHIPQVVARDNGKPVWLFKIDTFSKIYLKVWSPQMLVSPIVQIFRSENFPPKIPVFLNIWNKNPKFRNKYKIESFTIFGEPVCGPKVPIFEILNLKNGFLDENGAMTIEYGFHFDGLFDKTQAMWKFNLNSKLFDGRSKKNMMNYVGITEHFSHKQLILFHDSRARIKCATRKTDTLKLSEIIELFMFEKFLQIAHGVQLKLEGDKLMDVIRIAHRYGVQNVLKYCEIQLIMKFSELPKDRILEVFSRPLFLTNLVKVAVHYNLNRLLAFLLNHLSKNSKIENRIFLEKLKLDEMTNDSMKMIVAKVVYGKS